MTELEAWGPGVDRLLEGDVVAWDGRTVGLRKLIQRRWGWPKSAAKLAAAHLRAHAGDDPPVLWIAQSQRDVQQGDLLFRVPGLVQVLCAGLAQGAQREVHDASRRIEAVEVVFDQAIDDDGLVTDILQAVANRLGTSMDEMRVVTHFSSRPLGTTVRGTSMCVTLVVRASEFEDDDG